jgi:RND superfamily putative drug exporter
MSPLGTSRSIAARMGRWSAAHRRTAIAAWLGFVIAAIAIGTAAGQRTIDQQHDTVGQSHRADELLAAAGFAQSRPLTEMAVVQSARLTLADPAYRAVVGEVVAAVSRLPGAVRLRSPLSHADQVSRDGRTALVEWDMSGTLAGAERRIDSFTGALARVAAANPSFYVGEAGAVSTTKAMNTLFGRQLAQAGERSVPVTLLVLLLAFGSLIAAWVPLMLGLQSVVATLGLVDLVSHVAPMDKNVQAVVMLIGLAVGVDYTLFYLRREREERAAGRSARAALEAAAATSGRSVIVSGATVMVAMAGMLLARDQTFTSFSIATIIVVAVAMIGSLTALPAMLATLGDRVERGRIPLLGRLRRARPAGRASSMLRRHPALSAGAAGAVLVAVAIPTLSLHIAQTGASSLPRSTPTIDALDRIEAAIPAQASPAVVAVRTDTRSPAFAAAVAKLRAGARGFGSIAVDANRQHTAARITIAMPGTGVDGESSRALASLRDRLLPASIGAVPGAEYAVTGQTAASHDWNRMMQGSLPVVFAFVLSLAFLLLLVSFRSLTLAVVSIALNLLSVAAAYGVVVAVFQYGWGESLLGFRSNGAIVSWLPLMMFVILFGLSMDYHVFILSRIREARDRGLGTQDAITQGSRAAARTVTSAATVMVGVFAVFATLPILDMKEFGIGLAAAVLIDATLVRGVLLPACLRLLGEAGWYLPSWLGWLPRIERRVAVSAEPVAGFVG